MQDAILLLVLPEGARLQIALQILAQIGKDSLKEEAHAPTNHHRAVIGSSNFFKLVILTFNINNIFPQIF